MGHSGGLQREDYRFLRLKIAKERSARDSSRSSQLIHCRPLETLRIEET
jgi:hypothetical protein